MCAHKKLKPACFFIYGNGFVPSDEQARFIVIAWLDKRKSILGEDAVVGVEAFLRQTDEVPYLEFINVINEVQEGHPGQFIDNILVQNSQSGNDIVFVAVWSPEDTPHMKNIFNSVD